MRLLLNNNDSSLEELLGEKKREIKSYLIEIVLGSKGKCVLLKMRWDEPFNKQEKMSCSTSLTVFIDTILGKSHPRKHWK